jgi:hypothetical protein
MHPRVQAQREQEAAASIDAAVCALANQFGVSLVDQSVPTRDMALRRLFAREFAAVRLQEIVMETRAGEQRADATVQRIVDLLAEAGVEAPVQSTDADPLMRAAWSLSAVADLLEVYLPKSKRKAKAEPKAEQAVDSEIMVDKGDR